MHCFNLGFGKDFAASSILLLARLGVFGGAKIGVKLQVAFKDFEEWCCRNQKKPFAQKIRTQDIQSEIDPLPVLVSFPVSANLYVIDDL